MNKKNFSNKKIELLLRNMPRKFISVPAKNAIDNTVFKATELMIEKEQVSRINFAEFLIFQMKIMKKRWWILQGALLLFACQWLYISGDANYIYRGMSIFATLFVILIIPELWGNMKCKSMEIEEASLFDLRKVYAAKLIAFGLVDTIFLTFFCAAVTQLQYFLLVDVLKQFVFPVMIAATICMSVFSCRNPFSELTTGVICIVANTLWATIVLNESIYYKITSWIWIGLFSASISLIIYSVRKVINNTSKYKERSANGFNFG